VDYLGKTQDEVREKLGTAFRQLFHATRKTSPFTSPQATIPRTSWMCAQRRALGRHVLRDDDRRPDGRQEEFDRLWKWAHTHMRHSTGPREGYFAWLCARDGRKIDPGSASNGEEWFAMSLFLAAGRWGNGEGVYDYERQANDILRVMIHKREINADDPNHSVISIFDREAALPRFVPIPGWAKVTAPSFNLPAYYELWARWAESDRSFWRSARTRAANFTAGPPTPKRG
jgi:oligosaccharide reducing-end xylanase